MRKWLKDKIKGFEDFTDPPRAPVVYLLETMTYDDPPGAEHFYPSYTVWNTDTGEMREVRFSRPLDRTELDAYLLEHEGYVPKSKTEGLIYHD